MKKRSLRELFRRLRYAFTAWWSPLPSDRPIGAPGAPPEYPRFVVDLSQLAPFGEVLDLCEHENARDVLGTLVLDKNGLAWELIEVDGQVTARVVSAIIEMSLEERRAIAHERIQAYSEELAAFGATMAEVEQRAIQHALIVARQAEKGRRKQFDAMIASGRFTATDDPAIVEGEPEVVESA